MAPDALNPENTAAGSVPADGFTFSALAEIDRSAPLGMADLARILSRCPKTIERAVRRGELPAPFRLLGRKAWTVSAILDHLQSRQAEALKRAARRDARIPKLTG